MSDKKSADGMIVWVKQNKNEIKTNDLPATVAHCESLKWKRK